MAYVELVLKVNNDMLNTVTIPATKLLPTAKGNMYITDM
jgi:hypothetical protein